MKFIVLIAFSLLTSCKHTQPLDNAAIQRSIPFEVLYEDAISNIPDPTEEVITSSKRLQEVFDAINSTRKPSLPLPEVDWSKEALVFINVGYRSTGGYSVQVDRIEKDAQEYTVYISGKSPKPTDMVTMVLTYPWVLVKFEKPSIPVVFRRSSE